MAQQFDLVVIGSGTAATVSATHCRKAGWSVAVVDHRPYGGTCALRGCDPKKMLVAAAEVMDGIARMADVNVIQGKASIDWAALQRFKRSFTDPVPARREQMLQEQGISTFHGKACFTGIRQVQIGAETLDAKHIVIAAGAEPAPLPVDGAGHLMLSDAFLELETLPQRLVFVGGGFIGFEFAHVAARAGADVVILNRGPHPLKQFDPDLVAALVERTQALGIRVLCNHEVRAVEQTSDGYTVRAASPDGKAVFEAVNVIHSGGRVPAVSDLDLEAANIAHEGLRILRNDFFQSTSNPAVYVVGDAGAPPLPLTPVAALEAGAAAANLLEGNHATVDYTGIPTAVFTEPVLARVGLLEAEAKAHGLRYRVKHETVPGWYSARRINESCYAFKVLVEDGSERVLGAHVVGPGAVEIINLFGLAMRTGLKATDLAYATFTYPTSASDLESMLP
ncbi:glutathione reductase (NADPH) [Thiogranum longum]|uniref:Glutathione reductase (NADPH) n=1 Tax=Thiogranum longum TaxID=1537524 RepID=A0A4R1HCR8_9GAMM|nr:NAD(P)/FAD-dependent oxidoreductase [Thiogranum longum]TCK18010.1 glutathione reductase (NADPH) [Thiogranum longum]